MPSKITFYSQLRGLLADIKPSAGRMPTVNLGTGTADATTFLRGDQTYATPTAVPAPGSVTLAMMAPVASGTVFYRKSAGTGDPEVHPLQTVKVDLGLTTKIALVGIADESQIDITPFSGQTVNSQVWRNTVGSVVSSMDENGFLTTGSGSFSVTSSFNATMWNGGSIGWTSGGAANSGSTLETGFARDGAGIIAAKQGTQPHTLRVYNTVAGSNWERGNVGFVSNIFTIGTYNSGTGNLRDIRVGEGNNKLGFFGTTAIAQPTTGTAGSAVHATAPGTGINLGDTFDGYTIQQVVRALRDLGLLA